jgi:rhodanese-related sulfurtransferase
MDRAPTLIRSRRTLAAAALILGGLAAMVGSPVPVRIDVARLAREIATEADHVDAVVLADWIRVRRPGLRVLDVRTPTEFGEYHLPTAENAPLETIVGLQPSSAETVVLYSAGGAHAAQAWVLLRALGHRNVFFLSGGLEEWMAEVMTPVIPEDPDLAATMPWSRIVDVSLYFGGTPKVVAEDPHGLGWRRSVDFDGGGAVRHQRPARRWRRGC